MREKHKLYLDEICPSDDRKPFQDISKAVQATTIILLIEKKLSRRRVDHKMVSLLKQDCKCNSTKKSAKLLPMTLEMGRSTQCTADQLCLPLV
jgi:hypothetical protein